MEDKDIWLDDEWGNINDEVLDPKWRHARTKAFRKNAKIKSREVYDIGTYILRSPGSDLLEFYDSMMLREDPNSKAYSYIPPSLVHRFRYTEDYPKETLCLKYNYGKNAYVRDCLKNYHDTDDMSYWNQTLKTRYDWLTNQPHTEYKFNTRVDLLDFLREKFSQKGFSSNLNPNAVITGNYNKENEIIFEEMWWRGDLAGWSIVFVPNEKFRELAADTDVSIAKLEPYAYKDICTVHPERWRLNVEKIVCYKNKFMFFSDLRSQLDLSAWLIRKRADALGLQFFTGKQYLQHCEENNLDPYAMLD